LTTLTYYSETGPLRDAALFMKFYSQAPEHRRRKIDSFVFDKDKRLSLGVELLLRKALEDLGEDPDSLQPAHVANGKPMLKGTDIEFNLSHSEERVMCSVSDRPVGCDVEMVRPIDLDLARRYFYGSEYEGIKAEDDPDRRYDLFYRYWTLKESFMKATGLGFELPLDSFCIHLDHEITVDQSVDSETYRFAEYFLDDGYRYAVCSQSGDFPPGMRHVGFDKYS